MRLSSKAAMGAAVWVAVMPLLLLLVTAAVVMAGSGSTEEGAAAFTGSFYAETAGEEQNSDVEKEKEGKLEADGDPQATGWKISRKGVAMAVGAAAVGVAATPLVVPAAVGMAGFGASGIAAGSWAAGVMSAYGGVVPVGSVCAMLQSVGTAGLATSTIVATETVAASLAGVSGYFFKQAPADDMHHAQHSAEKQGGGGSST